VFQSRRTQYIVTAEADALIWNVRTGQLVVKLEGNLGKSTAFTPDGTGLFSASMDCTVKFWDISFLAVVRSGSQFNSYIHYVAVSSDGHWLVTLSADGVRFWNAHNAELH